MRVLLGLLAVRIQALVSAVDAPSRVHAPTNITALESNVTSFADLVDNDGSNFTFGANDPSVQCLDAVGISGERLRPTTVDCAQALWKLPLQLNPGTFTRGVLPGLPFTLPQSFAAGRCKIAMDFVDRGVSSEDYGWVWLRSDILALMTACHSSGTVSTNTYRTGGAMITGPNRRIKINITKLPQSVSAANNPDLDMPANVTNVT